MPVPLYIGAPSELLHKFQLLKQTRGRNVGLCFCMATSAVNESAAKRHKLIQALARRP